MADTAAAASFADEIKSLLARADRVLATFRDEKWKRIEGLTKLIGKVQVEAEKLRTSLSALTADGRDYGNLPHLLAVAELVEKEPQVLAVSRQFSYEKDDEGSCVETVDLVCDRGRRWIKVKAINTTRAGKCLQSDDTVHHRSLIDVAHDILKCAKQQKTPDIQVRFHFVHDLEPAVEQKISATGVVVITPNAEKKKDACKDAWEQKQPPPLIGVNLDVTSLIYLVSDITNDPATADLSGCSIRSGAQSMVQQEQKNPSLPQAMAFLAGRPLFVCQTALRRFRSILEVIARDTERIRAVALLKRCTVIEDQPSGRIQSLDGVKAEPRVIFGTGDQRGLVTMTSNLAFVAAAQRQTVSIEHFEHPARCLAAKPKPHPEPGPK